MAAVEISECPACGGDGAGKDEEGLARPTRCPTCGGTGRQEKPLPVAAARARILTDLCATCRKPIRWGETLAFNLNRVDHLDCITAATKETDHA